MLTQKTKSRASLSNLIKYPTRNVDWKNMLTLRPPCPEDGTCVHALISQCPPLDTNSMYCNLLQCHHFADTCALAEYEQDVVGFVSGYLMPSHPDTLFVWQVAVAEAARGMGLAKRLIKNILGRPTCQDVRFLRTTITSDNLPSWALFRGLARQLGADTQDRKLFDRERHFSGQHASEHELIIGPFEYGSTPS